MAHFWIPKLIDARSCWGALPLGGSAYEFIDVDPFVRRVELPAATAGGEMLLRANGDAATAQWLLVDPPGDKLWVNGREVLLGAHLLADRDEMRFPNGRRLFFCTERLPRVIPFPGAAHEIFCSRCRNPIVKDSLAVECPGCASWSHQTGDLPCWNYPGTNHCALCDQSNDPDAGFRWAPESPSHEN
jgi:hypothetical protein